MPRTPAEIEALATLIARTVPEELMAAILREQGRLPKFKDWRKTAENPQRGRLFALVKMVIEAAEAEGFAPDLLLSIYRRVDWDVAFLKALALHMLPAGGETALQAFHVRRDSLIASGLIEILSRQVEPRICCLVGQYLAANNVETSYGTGFLVGPDLVLTAAHVVAPFVDEAGHGIANPRIAAFFDYRDGPKVTSFDQAGKGVKRVGMAPKWLLDISPSTPDDGMVDPRENDALAAQLLANCDFALIQLAEPVGYASVSSGGGPRRGWMEISQQAPLLGIESRIIIVQHAGGEPRQLDFGRYKGGRPFRFWYDVETEKGTSGAPCLTRELKIAGLHNAAFVPERWNQGVPISLIQPRIEEEITKAAHRAAPPSAPATLWNLADPGSPPRIVLGRAMLLQFLERASAQTTTRRADRLYAAVASARGTGKTFSIEILRRALASQGGAPLVVFGPGAQLLPGRVEDFIRVLADTLGVPTAELGDMPARPQADLPSPASDGDKQNRWASETVPRWFARKLDAFRPGAYDMRPDAIAKVKELSEGGLEIASSFMELANSPEPVMGERGWRTGWIAIDGIADTKLEGEIRDLIGGLCGTGQDEADVPPILLRLRWLFLGYRPDFIESGGVLVETLAADSVTSAHSDAFLSAASASRGFPVEQERLDDFKNLVGVVIRNFDKSGRGAEFRLSFLQDFLSEMVETFLPGGAT